MESVEAQTNISEKAILAQIDQELGQMDKHGKFPSGSRYYFEQIIRARLTGESLQQAVKQANSWITSYIQDDGERKKLLEYVRTVARAGK